MVKNNTRNTTFEKRIKIVANTGHLPGVEMIDTLLSVLQETIQTL